MGDRWEVVIESPAGEAGPVPEVPYGPAGDRLPARFDALVSYQDRPLRVRIAASFDGVERVKATVVAVERTDGASVTPEDMTALQLGAVMIEVVALAWKLTGGPGDPVWQIGRSSGGGPPTDEELRLLARMYWLSYVAWGNPRQAIMNSFGLPRSTANRWIRKARELYGLPGAHADEEA